MPRRELKELPEAVRLAVEQRLPLGWGWFEGEGRTVMSGYGLYARTGTRNNGAAIERRVYLTCDRKRAESLNGLLNGLLGDSDVKRLKNQVRDLSFIHEF